MPRRSSDRRRAVAYHEAGHALAHYVQHLRFKHVTITPDAESDGHVKLRFRMPTDQQVYAMSPIVRDRFERHIVALLAGREAQRLVTKRYDHFGARVDLHAARECFYRIVEPDDVGVLYFRWLRARARQLVNAPHWRPLLDALAAALLQREMLTEDEAVEVFEIAQGLPPASRRARLRAQLSG